MDNGKGMRMNWVLHKHKWTSMVAALLLGVVLLAGCSSGNNNSASDSGGMASIANEVSFDRQVTEGGAEEKSMSDEAESAEAPASAGNGGAGLPANAAGVTQGKIIYTANVTMVVEELKTASSKLRDAIHLSGGYMLEFNDIRHDGEIGATYTIKVPADGFMSFIDAVEQIENLDFGKSVSGKDVTEEYVDLESRLKAKQLVELRLIDMMDQATKADDLLQFSNQLGAVQEEIESIKGKIRYLDNNVSFSTISIRMVQRDQSMPSLMEEEEKGFGTRLADTLEGSFDVVVEGVKLILIIIVGALPVIAVLAVILVPIWMIVQYRRNQRKSNPVKRIEPIQESDEPKTDD